MNDDKNYKGSHRTPRVFVGLILLVVGGVLIARESGVYFPEWLFSWPMILIIVGFVIGVKSRFYGIGWFIPIIVGSYFLIDQFFPGMQLKRYLIPVAVIIVGLFFIFRNKMSYSSYKFKETGPMFHSSETANYLDGDIIDENAVFASIKKNVISKNFLGGDINTVFGNCEINLAQAEIESVAKMEVNAVFGSIRLIVPPHWQINLSNNSVLGGVEDKRPDPLTISDKVLKLEANAVFGGIEIRNY